MELMNLTANICKQEVKKVDLREKIIAILQYFYIAVFPAMLCALIYVKINLIIIEIKQS